MRLYGALSELASLVIRLASGKTVTVKSAEQQNQDTEVTVPNLGSLSQVDFLMVETLTPQEIKSKTINFTQNTITAGSLDITALKADAAVGNQVLQKNPSTGVIEGVLLTNANIAPSAQIADTKLAKITTANKVDSGAVQAVQGDNGRVLSFDANGAPSAALISNVNIAANALISGSKITDLPASSLALMSSADLAGRVTDETGSGALVFGTEPILTNAKVSGYEDFNHATTPASNPTGAVRVYAKSDNKLYTLSPAGIEQAVGSGGTVDLVSQTAHGFAIGDVLWLDPGNPPTIPASYKKAKADAANTAEVVGVVSRTLGADSFELTLSGEVGGLSGLVAGEVYFLSAATAGALTVTEPSVVGQVSLPVGVASSTTSLYVAPKRGVVVGGANLRTQIGLNGAALVSQTTNIQNVTAYTAGELSGWVYIDATTDRRFYIQVQFVKDAANAWKCAYQTTGDTPPQGFNVDVIVSGSDAFVQVQMPPVAGWVSGSVNFALNAPAVGATLPLQISGANVTGPVLAAGTGAAIPSGYIGETKIATVSTLINLGITNNSYSDIPGLSLSLEAGRWEITATIGVGTLNWASGAGTYGVAAAVIRDAADTNLVRQIYLYAGDPTAATAPALFDIRGTTVTVIVSPTTTTTYKLSQLLIPWAGNPVFNGNSIRADVVPSLIRAVRIA